MPSPKDPIKREEWRRKISEVQKGKVISLETRQKMSKSRIGLKPSLETRKKLSHPRKNPRSPEHCRKLSESNKGRIVSTETRKKLSEALRGEKSPLFGKPKSPEHRRKLSEANKGKHHSAETRRKISGSNGGSKCYLWKGGISFAPYCVKFNDEFRERVRAFFRHTCQICGHVWKKGEPRLAVHHVNYRKDSCCDKKVPRLFVPLCSLTCHTKTSHDRQFWEDWFTEIINEFYNGKCYFSKEEMIKFLEEHEGLNEKK